VNIFQAVLLGIVQGLTEFIPVSSSGHLVVMHDVFGVSAGGLIFDVALHIGTLLALILFFHKDILLLARALFVRSTETPLAKMLVLATVPAAVAGVYLQSAAETSFRSSRIVAVNLMVFGLVMLLAERYARRFKRTTTIGKVTPQQALIMGMAQAFAIIPGVSRSGSTITSGLFAGLDRVSATRFSFLLAIPITFGAILKVLLSDAALSQIGAQTSIFVAGIVAAFLSGLFAIRFLLRYLANHSLAAFAYYRLALGVIILLALVR
jgi:undecaprenyl-diphosphatase